MRGTVLPSVTFSILREPNPFSRNIKPEWGEKVFTEYMNLLILLD